MHRPLKQIGGEISDMKNDSEQRQPDKHKDSERLISRRNFLKLSIPAAAALAVTAGQTTLASARVNASSASPEAAAMLYDTSKCLGCRRCENACRRWNGLQNEYRPTDLSSKSLTTLKYRQVEVSGKVKWLPSKWQCMHCVDPSCANVCPTGALHKTEAGPVLYDETKCIGCQYCVEACPFSVPRFDWETNRMIKKCTFCADRTAEGTEPACSSVCPVQALSFGQRGTILKKAEEAQAAGNYLYGKEEAGGTSWIYISDVPFEQRGVPTVAKLDYPLPSKALVVPQFGAMAAGALALGAYSVYLRRKKAQQ
jgi:formate dehydrogenase iron-sulfur subunit